MQKIEYIKKHKEEFVTYYYALKSDYDNISDFVIEVNKETMINFNISSLRKMNNAIPQEELFRFLSDSKIANDKIINIEGIELDWNLSEFVIETVRFYILRMWEVTA